MGDDQEKVATLSEDFQVTELDDKDLEDASGGVLDNNNCSCGNDNCGCGDGGVGGKELVNA
jgi:hypothetical protein